MKFPFYQLRWSDDVDSATIDEFQTLEEAQARQRFLARRGILACIGKVTH